MSERRLELLRALYNWAGAHEGRMPTLGRIDRATWLSLAFDDAFVSVLGGDSVIWVGGIPFKGDPSLGYHIVDFSDPPTVGRAEGDGGQRPPQGEAGHS